MDEVFMTANKEKSHTYKEYEYLEYDRKAIKQSSNMFTTVDPELVELEDSDSDKDEDKVKLESDEDELIRRLKFVKLTAASEHLVKAVKIQKEKDDIKLKENRVTLKASVDGMKIAADQYREDCKISPFVPKWTKSKAEITAMK